MAPLPSEAPDSQLVLVISNKWDLSVDYVVSELRERDVPFIRLNTEDLPGSHLSIRCPDLAYVLHRRAGDVDFEESLRSVYFRRPGVPLDQNPPTQLTESALEYIRNQWYSFVRGLLALDGVLWMNSPARNEVAENKVIQLMWASRLGFRVPSTCITSSKREAAEFVSRMGGEVAAKALYSPLIEDPDQDYFIFTNRVKDLSMAKEDEFELAPTIFQELIVDKTDYRVTVVGDETFVAKIISHDDSKPVPLDWRTKKEGLRFVKSELPRSVEKLCLEMTRHAGLEFGALDLVESNGTFYFLEINPNGEWGWLQREGGFPIAEAIANCLTYGLV